MRIVSFVALCSNSGKTTLIEKVVPLLVRRGLRVAVVKHASTGFDLDKPGKDSWRFQQAGAETVVIVGPRQMAIVKSIEREPEPEELERAAGDVDIIIQEGFKHNARNKIEVYRSAASDRQPLCLSDSTFLALVSDRRFDVAVPQLDIDDAEAVAEFIFRQC